ncbi:methyl-accepting chemotaxis protein [Vibrio sonorensis]|uniref:methyl-accepting chemotaxis protein n=1 Tax=Vibrio sonorensis TaxID=1004316 RepID=UPI0008D96517|nr:methyl-accepting chemotaxis protein [Vibrio sonorensis]
MFKNLKLGFKVGIGFGVVLTLLSVVLGVSVMALQTADDGIVEYRELARDTNLAGRLQANMLMVRMNVKDYLITKSDKDIQQYQEYLDKMNNFLEESKREIQKPERAQLVAQVDQSILQYEQAFDKVVNLIAERNAVDQTQLVPNGEKMRELIYQIMNSAFVDGDADATYYAANVMEKMLVGRLYVVKFLQSNSEIDFDVAIENMQRALQTEIDQLDINLQNPNRRALLGEFVKAHDNYVQAMNDIHNLILVRNDIIENTLDVIGPQVAQQVEEVKLSVMRDQDSLGPVLKAKTTNSVKTSVFLSVAALAIGIIAAYLLTIAITRPIKRAVEAANRLSEGDLTVNVGSTAKDETGSLLRAVQNTASNLKQMISTISSASQELASASEELAVVTEQQSEGINRQETETEMIATAMNEMATTVHDVADNAANASDAANQADNTAISGAR